MPDEILFLCVVSVIGVVGITLMVLLHRLHEIEDAARRYMTAEFEPEQHHAREALFAILTNRRPERQEKTCPKP